MAEALVSGSTTVQGARAKTGDAVTSPGTGNREHDLVAVDGVRAMASSGVAVRVPARLPVFSVVALVLVVLAGLYTLIPDRAAPVALRPLSSLPQSAGQWHEDSRLPDVALPVDPDVPQHLSRAYRRGADIVWLSIGYYPALDPGRHPRAQQLVLPAQGYAALTTRSVAVPLADQSLAVNLVALRTPERHTATLYWYHVGGRSVASDHGYRALLLYNRLWRRRADVALIRVASPVAHGDLDAVVRAQTSFIAAVYPELRRSLPEP